MKQFAVGAIVVLNNKAESLHTPKGWIVPGRQVRIVETAYLNKRKRKCWYLVDLLGKSMRVIGRVKVPSNWLDPL